MKALLLLAFLAFALKKRRAGTLPEETPEEIDFDAMNAEMAAAFITAMTAGRGIPPMQPRGTGTPFNVRIPLPSREWNLRIR